MTGLEITLIIAGIAIVVVSFLFGEQLDGNRSNEKGTDSINSDEIKEAVKNQVDEAVDDAIDSTVEKTAVELDKLSNEKIMAVSEYSENVLKEIEKNHEEVMFLYGMLNDKEEQIKNTVKDVEMVKASVKKMTSDIHTKKTVKSQENTENQSKDKANEKKTSPQNKKPVKKRKETVQNSVIEEDGVKAGGQGVTESTGEPHFNNNQKILELYNAGKDNIDIARELNLGLGEVRLVIDLYKTRGNK